MGVILSGLAGIMYLGFFWHDRAFIQAAAYETVSWASLHTGEEKTEAVMQTLIEGRVLGTDHMEVSGNAGKKEACVRCQGSFAMPGLLQNLFEKTDVLVETEVHLSTESPSRKIQKIRGLMKIADSIGGNMK